MGTIGKQMKIYFMGIGGTAMGNAAQVMTDFVSGFVRRWLKNLV